MWGTKTKRRGPKGADLTAYIDEGAEIEGACAFTGTVMLNGTVRGRITSTDTVIVGEKGAVHAEVQAPTIVVSGQVGGNLVASQRLEMRRGARIVGDVDAPIVVMEEGVSFQGHCRTGAALREGATPATDASTTAAATSPARDLSVVR